MSAPNKSLPPLAERMRPQSLEQVVGQSHLLKKGAPLYTAIHSGHASSVVLWGHPGVGKTTIARLVAQAQKKQLYLHSAATIGVSAIRKIINNSLDKTSILFLDEIHRFNKSQQDILLQAIENGSLILIGATTENPSFEVNKALLSRCHVWTLHPLSDDELGTLLKRAIAQDEVLHTKQFHIQETEALFAYSNGDARKLFNALEALSLLDEEKITINNQAVKQCLQQKIAIYDKYGEEHYNLISAFIKSVRGSDADASIYWLARMLHAGEDILFIARRMIILAAEDIGLANPNALMLANATFESAHKIGMPEARIILAQCAIYLAYSEKSNSAYKAINKALYHVEEHSDVAVPLYLRNASSSLNQKIGYGKKYQYPHDTPHHTQQYLPAEIKERTFFEVGNNTKEKLMKRILEENQKKKIQENI